MAFRVTRYDRNGYEVNPYVIMHRHGNGFLAFGSTTNADYVDWQYEYDDSKKPSIFGARLLVFKTIEEAKEAILKYSDGNKYGWIGLEKGAHVVQLVYSSEGFVSEEQIDKRREAEKNGTN